MIGFILTILLLIIALIIFIFAFKPYKEEIWNAIYNKLK